MVAVVCSPFVPSRVEALVAGDHLNRGIRAIREIDTRAVPH